MGKIQRLSALESQKIAAGEVVDRPTNVVKELIENALDAESTTVSVYIEQGGHNLIRIVDNGSGMDHDDAHACFEQHATSKIRSVEELTTIQTFGFRGEALASISAVGHVTLITKQAEAQTGYKITRSGDTITTEEISCPTGTDISIKDLFYNVPARKKFLKKPETEWRQITTLFQAFCFQHPSVHFKLYHDTKLIHNCPPVTSLQQRIAQLWNAGTAHNTVTLPDYAGNGFTFTGIITNHQYHRYDRNQIFFFVNNRWVKNPGLSKALVKGYNNVLPPAKFPAACIALTVDADQVDINIHPRKEEVQFLHPRRIESAITTTVTDALQTHISTQITSQPSQPYLSSTPRFESHNFGKQFEKPFIFSSSPSRQQTFTPRPQAPVVTEQQTTPFQTSSDIPGASHLIGQLHNTYLLLQHEHGLYVVDQHAAHERILYERFKDRFGNLETVPLLFPVVIHVTEDDAQILHSHIGLLADHGIGVEPSGNGQFTVHATPVHVKHIDFTDLIKTVISWIREHDHADSDQLFKLLNEKLRAQMACKAAVKAGDTLTSEQMKTLLEDLHTVDNRFSCPHGRPTGWLLSTYEIEKKFKRRA